MAFRIRQTHTDAPFSRGSRYGGKLYLYFQCRMKLILCMFYAGYVDKNSFDWFV